MLYFWKGILKLPTFRPLFFLTKLSQKHKIIFSNKMKLGKNPKKLFLHPKSNFTICEKNLQQVGLFLKSYDSFVIILIFRFVEVLPICDAGCVPLCFWNSWLWPQSCTLVLRPDLNNFADLFKNDILISICVCLCICVKCQVFKILTNIKYGSGSVASTGALKCLSRLEEISMKRHAAKKIGFWHPFPCHKMGIYNI